jgi:hypothetical protein
MKEDGVGILGSGRFPLSPSVLGTTEADTAGAVGGDAVVAV